MNTKYLNWALVIVAVLTLVGATAALIYGITTHEEPGLMQDAPHWNRNDFPLTVCATTYSATDEGELSEEHDAALQYVIDTTNDRLDFTAFVRAWSHSGDHCHVWIVLDAPYEEGWMDRGGNAVFATRDEHLACDIRTSNVFGEMLTLVLQHEMGHCLGLAHDDFALSIMRPTQYETPDRELPPWITDSDRDLLRELYSPR